MKKKEKKKMVYIRPCGGLGNRILFLFSMLYYQERYGFSMTILWRHDPACNVRYGSLFKFDESISFIRVHDYIKMSYKKFRWLFQSFIGGAYELYLKMKCDKFINMEEMMKQG